MFSFLLFCPFLTIGQLSNPFDVSKRSESVVTQTPLEDTSEFLAAPVTTQSLTTDSVALSPPSSNNPFDVRMKQSPDQMVAEEQRDEVDDEDAYVKPITPIKEARNLKVYDFLLAFVSIVLLLLAVLVNRKQFSMILKFLMSTTLAQNYLRTKKIWLDPQVILLYFLFFLNLSFFLYAANRLSLIDLSFIETPLWISIFILLSLVYLVRHLSLTIINYVFELGRVSERYNISIGLHNIVFGVFILPIIFGMNFGPSFIVKPMYYCGISLWILIYSLRQFKGIFLAIGIRGFNPIYFFLYLCAVEISPILIGIRIILDGAL